jgi:carbon monoxide dehydrogenase subunit G
MQYEHTEHVEAPPDAVYVAISDVTNLPSFVPQIPAARPAGEGRVEVDARYEGHEQDGKARFSADDAARKIEWGTANGYHGWLQVDADGDGSRLTLFLDTPHAAASDHDVAATLDAIRMLVESKV